MPTHANRAALQLHTDPDTRRADARHTASAGKRSHEQIQASIAGSTVCFLFDALTYLIAAASAFLVSRSVGGEAALRLAQEQKGWAFACRIFYILCWLYRLLRLAFDMPSCQCCF